jgi:rod shape determining protein RodA
MREEKIYSGSTDWPVIILYLMLCSIGVMSIYSSSYETGGSLFDFGTKYGKQLLWFGISLAAGFSLFLFDSRFFNVFAYLFYAIFLGLLLIVLLVGRETFGSKSWIEIGGFSLQPSEFAKLGTALALGRYLSEYGTDVRKWSHRLKAIMIICVPMLMVLLQGDAGSSLVFMAFVFVLYREGLPGFILVLGFGLALIFVLTLLFGPGIITMVAFFICLIFASFGFRRKQLLALLLVIVVVVAACSFSVQYVFDNALKVHQKKRILVTLKLLDDPKGFGYNVNQSKIAIGSGGFWGKGYLQGTQTKGDFVPEQTTDFIFSNIGEEFGMVGTWLLVILYTMLLVRIVFIAERQKNRFNRIYCYGVASILFFHFAVNIGMAIDLLPVIGIPLPFLSYGGSSLLAFTLLLFLLVRLDANREHELDTIGKS